MREVEKQKIKNLPTLPKPYLELLITIIDGLNILEQEHWFHATSRYNTLQGVPRKPNYNINRYLLTEVYSLKKFHFPLQ